MGFCKDHKVLFCTGIAASVSLIDLGTTAFILSQGGIELNPFMKGQNLAAWKALAVVFMAILAVSFNKISDLSNDRRVKDKGHVVPMVFSGSSLVAVVNNVNQISGVM